MLFQIFMLALLLVPLQCLPQVTNYGPRLTNAALKIQGAISKGCNATDSCTQFVSYVIPKCQRLQGDAGCWCDNHGPLHTCALCMSNLGDNRTTPDQVAEALQGHTNYHQVCSLFKTSLNASSTVLVEPSITPVSAKGGTKPKSGGAIGSTIGLPAVIALPIVGGLLLILLLWVWIVKCC